MLRRLVAAAALAGTAALAAPASADPLPDLDFIQQNVVGYRYDPATGDFAVGTGIPGQPLLWTYGNLHEGWACAGFSLQVPQCTNRISQRVWGLVHGLIQTG